jgi:hypothetical protein
MRPNHSLEPTRLSKGFTRSGRVGSVVEILSEIGEPVPPGASARGC